MLSMFIGIIVGAGAMAILLTFDKAAQDNNLLSVFMVCMGEGERAAHRGISVEEASGTHRGIRERAIRFGYHWAMERRR